MEEKAKLRDRTDSGPSQRRFNIMSDPHGLTEAAAAFSLSIFACAAAFHW